MPEKWPRRFCCDEDLALIGYDGRDAREGPRVASNPRSASAHARADRRHPRRRCRRLARARHRGRRWRHPPRACWRPGRVERSTSTRPASTSRQLARRPIAGASTSASTTATATSWSSRASSRRLTSSSWTRDLLLPVPVQPCYTAAIEPRPRLLGLTYPRDTWWMRTFMRAYNATHSLARSPARYFIHRHRAVRACLPRPATPRSITAGCQSGGLPSIDATRPSPPTRFAVCR